MYWNLAGVLGSSWLARILLFFYVERFPPRSLNRGHSGINMYAYRFLAARVNARSIFRSVMQAELKDSRLECKFSESTDAPVSNTSNWPKLWVSRDFMDIAHAAWWSVMAKLSAPIFSHYPLQVTLKKKIQSVSSTLKLNENLWKRFK